MLIIRPIAVAALLLTPKSSAFFRSAATTRLFGTIAALPPPGRAMTAFQKDDFGDWVAVLECGHFQHVRHDPPMTERPWVVTKEGRESFICYKLKCKKCQRGERKDKRTTANDPVPNNK